MGDVTTKLLLFSLNTLFSRSTHSGCSSDVSADDRKSSVRKFSGGKNTVFNNPGFYLSQSP